MVYGDHSWILSIRPNAEAASDDSLKEERQWDMRYFEFVSRSVVVHAQSKAFWARLEQVKDDYAYVVQELQAADLPEIFAAIPYHESQYRSSNQSPACAEGYWQVSAGSGQSYGVRGGSVSVSGVKPVKVLIRHLALSPKSVS